MAKPCILLIDDHKEYREAVRHFLELHHLDIDILEACSGEEGVFVAKKNKPAIIITDFSLGGINGLETAIQIKKDLPLCSIIMLTIYDSKEILRRDTRGIINFYVSKSDLYDQLVPVIKKIMRLSEAPKKAVTM